MRLDRIRILPKHLKGLSSRRTRRRHLCYASYLLVRVVFFSAASLSPLESAIFGKMEGSVKTTKRNQEPYAKLEIDFKANLAKHTHQKFAKPRKSRTRSEDVAGVAWLRSASLASRFGQAWPNCDAPRVTACHRRRHSMNLVEALLHLGFSMVFF